MSDPKSDPSRFPPTVDAEFDHIPEPIRSMPNWVLWRHEWRGNSKGGGRWTKVPCQVNGMMAKSNDPLTWNTLPAVMQGYFAGMGSFHGVGFCFPLDGTLFIGGDCDNVIAADGTIAPWVLELQRRIPTYWERSVSGTGAHFISLGHVDLPAHKWAQETGELELYARGSARFFIVTGVRLPGSTEQPTACADAIAAVVKELEERKARVSGHSITAPATSTCPAPAVALEPSEQRRLAMRAMLAVPVPATEGDGSKRLVQLCRQAVRYSLGDAEAIAMVRQVCQLTTPLPRDYTDEEIIRRLRDVARRVTPGEALVKRATSSVSTAGQNQGSDDKPDVRLPGGRTTISHAAGILGTKLAKSGNHFIRGGGLVTMTSENDHPAFKPISCAALASEFETVAKLFKMTREGEVVAANCNEATAKLISHSAAFVAAMPEVRILTACPVLIERNGVLEPISGYDRASGILAMGKPVVDVPLGQAQELLSRVIQDFQFATPFDRSRAFAAIITPALIQGLLLGARAPVDLGEADDSQSGKGFRNRLTAAIYGTTVATISQKKRGVGSLEESFDSRLVKGASFISLDNMRGHLDSPMIESFITEDRYAARAPYSGYVEIDPRRIIVMLTSNKAEITTDMANRSSTVRILKQVKDYSFAEYPEGDILDQVRAWQPWFLGAVFSVIRAWHTAGKPRTSESRHDFRCWARVLDWIVQNLLGAAPLMDGHRETQARMTQPVLNWLRDVALQVQRAGRLGIPLPVADLVTLLEQSGTVEIPGVKADADLSDDAVRRVAFQGTGKRLALAFNTATEISLDGITIARLECSDPAHSRIVRRYRFCARVPAPPVAGTG